VISKLNPSPIMQCQYGPRLLSMVSLISREAASALRCSPFKYFSIAAVVVSVASFIVSESISQYLRWNFPFIAFFQSNGTTSCAIITDILKWKV
jgi:hypothetical protein